MPILILKTDLNSPQGIDAIRPILNLHPAILNWNVDTEDIDNVLRVEAKQNLADVDIIALLTQYGVVLEILTA
jgi:hypothetical protein